MSKKEFLVVAIDEKIKSFKEQSSEHKNMHRNFRYAAFIFTAVLSVFSGLALYLPASASSLNIAILIVSAIAGILASMEGLRKPDELWIHERTILYTLIDLKRELEFELQSNHLSDKKLDNLFSEFQKILSNSGAKWRSGIVPGKNSDEESPEQV